MAETKPVSVAELRLDLSNYRTVPQPDELHAAQALVSIEPEWFWGLMDSLLDSGYLPTENILVLRGDGTPSELTVKEGNRRIAALKLILGYLPAEEIDLPSQIVQRIATLPPEWKSENEQVPCAIYEAKDAAVVDKIVTLTHGKGERAGRAAWTAVARARHNRDENGATESGLDLLEKYLKLGKNLTPSQAERWAGDYPLTVLDEAIKRTATRFGASHAPDLAKRFPAISHRAILETMLRDIGLKIVQFSTIRDKDRDFAVSYGLPDVGTGGTSEESTGDESNDESETDPHDGSDNTDETKDAENESKEDEQPKKTAAVGVNDPKGVKRALTAFTPRGKNRQKVVTLRNEAKRLNLAKNPLAFCFVLRSMFEISAKAYSEDYRASGGPSFKKANGQEKKLVDVLREITEHLTDQKQDKEMLKVLHGAMTELAKPEGILSVTSMNQLVHNPSFSITPGDISIVFGNVFPLLEAMNQ